MSRATPKMRNLAEHLIAHETTGESFLVVEKLRPNLATLMGKAGFRALVSRALALANSEVYWLRALHVRADGSIEGLDDLRAQVNAREFAEGGVVLLGQLLGLLVAFIGEGLTLRLLLDLWPKLRLDEWASSTGGKNEKAE
jgi:hypothetical protein